MAKALIVDAAVAPPAVACDAVPARRGPVTRRARATAC